MLHFGNSAGRRRVHQSSPVQFTPQARPQLPLDGIIRLADRPFAGMDDDAPAHQPVRGRPCFDDDSGGHAGPDDVVTAVVLAGDTVQALHVDGVGRVQGWLKPSAAGKRLVMVLIPTRQMALSGF